MPPHQFVGDAGERVGDGEMSRFGLELRHENGFEEEIAELLAERGVVVAVDGLEHLVGLFEHVGLQRVDGLLAVPRAAARCPKCGHNVNEARELLHLLKLPDYAVARLPNV